jgi:hypothetical protein
MYYLVFDIETTGLPKSWRSCKNMRKLLNRRASPFPKRPFGSMALLLKKRIARANYWLMFYLGVKMGLPGKDRPAAKDYCGSIFGRRVYRKIRNQFAI